LGSSKQGRRWNAGSGVWLAGAFLVSGLGCESGENLEGGQWGQGEFSLVQQATFNRAFEIVRGINYLPFAYKADGCYVRALYMSMELAAQQIESNSLFAFAKDGYPLYVEDLSWQYHVAPMLVVAGEPLRWMIIDPALTSVPVTDLDWLHIMGRDKPEYAHAVRESQADVSPDMVFVPGSRYSVAGAGEEQQYVNKDLPDFPSLPPFEAADIAHACTVGMVYLTYEARNGASTTAEASRKQTLLIRRTAELGRRLASAGKLSRELARSYSSGYGFEVHPSCQNAVSP